MSTSWYFQRYHENNFTYQFPKQQKLFSHKERRPFRNVLHQRGYVFGNFITVPWWKLVRHSYCNNHLLMPYTCSFLSRPLETDSLHSHKWSLLTPLSNCIACCLFSTFTILFSAFSIVWGHQCLPTFLRELPFSNHVWIFVVTYHCY